MNVQTVEPRIAAQSGQLSPPASARVHRAGPEYPGTPGDVLSGNIHDPGTPPAERERLVRYYSEAGPDYGLWSRRLNMHFGFWRFGMNPLRREPMLERMTDEVLDRLRLDPGTTADLLDLGCGVGTPARHASRRFKRAAITGLTLVPWQVERACELNRDAGLQKKVSIRQGDYTAAPFGDESFDAAYAMESACYAPGLDKEPLLKEARRLLRPGGRLVVADGFVKKIHTMPPLLHRIYAKICECWSLNDFADIHAFTAALERVGFTDVQVEDISFNIAPSVLHIPLVSLKFLVIEVAREWLHGRRVGHERWNNLIAPVLSPLLGMARRHFGYYLVTARK